MEGEKLTLREQWVVAYDRARQGWGAVEWVEDLGEGYVGERNDKVRKLHDRWALPQDEAGQIG